jgi:hypothetical protein
MTASVQFEAKYKKTDPWLVASILLCLTTTTVACAEKAEIAKDRKSSRAYLMEAREAGQKFLRLVKSARVSPDRDVAVRELSRTIIELECL